jgi:diaminopimelate epimerase
MGEGLTLAKYEAAGNDFLIALDRAGTLVTSDRWAAALCDRHRGVGADGLIRLGRSEPGGVLSMALRNADGGLAETSGNGLRCVARAAVEAGLAAPGRFAVATLAGERSVAYDPLGADGPHWAHVEMGPVTLGPPAPAALPAIRARTVDVGNPHLVILVPGLGGLDVVGEGRRLQETYPGGINVEFVVAAVGGGSAELAVFERGVGETLACGSGTVAAAAALRSWGLAGDAVLVQNPGGTLEVALGESTEAELAGPVHRVAEVLVAPEWLETLAGAPADAARACAS